ncbi:MAG: S8 family serine peptidase [Cytophagales bacterium]|nr:S8 family serine peptidase [Cytophagales bacterium]
MKRFCTLFFVMGLSVSSFGQDWAKDKTSLYYWGSQGKVFIEPEYSSMAVYFKDTPSKDVSNRFKAGLSQMKVDAGIETNTMELMELKGMMRINSVSGLKSIGTTNQKNEFLETYGLLDEGAYDVLPSFMIGDKQAWLTKRVMIRLNDGVPFSRISTVLSKYGARFIKNITNVNTFLLSVEQLDKQLPLIQELHDMGVLEWGEPDFKVELVRYIDPNYSDQWHLNNTGGSIDGKALVADIDVNAPEAWAITTGSSSVVVAVIDDGVESHEDMPSLLTGYTPADGGNGTPSISSDGHGQQCSGLISAQHNEIGARGIAPGVSTFSVNIFAPNTTNSDLADAVNWAVNSGADVLTNSWGFGSCTYNLSALTDAFANAATNGRGGLGCIILIASGNDFYDCVSYPADLPTVTAVGGISGDGGRSMFSNYGPALDIVAPSDDDWVQQGGVWYSTGTHGLRTIDRMGSAGSYSGNYSESFGGTSGATPQVAAVAALVLSVNPNLTKSEVESILYNTAKNVGSSNEYGAGLVDAYAAVVAAGGSGDTDPPSIPNGLSSSNVGSSSFDVSWNASTDDTGVTGYNVFVDGSNVGSVSGTSTSITGLSPSSSYSITVSAYDAASNESAQSSAINVTTTIATLSCSSTITSFPYSEGFESNDGWTQVSGDDGDWVRDSGGTPSSGTGPSSAVEGSFYMFLEASTNGSTAQIGANATAILESDCFDLSGQSSATFSFQHHMYGTSIGTLAIQASTDDQSWNTLWTLSGDQGNIWNSVDVSLDSYAGGSVKLRIVGTTGSSWSSDIAVDDLSVTGGGGPDTEAPTTPSGLTSSNISSFSFDVSWNASADNVGVTQYNVYLDGSNLSSVTGTAATITGLTASTTYQVSVEAQDAAGNVSGQTSINVTTASSGGCTNQTVDNNNFDGGWGIWNDGGSDARRNSKDAAYANSGSYCARLRDNTSTSVITTDNLDLSAFDDITVTFSYIAMSMESNEDFWLQISTNGGSSYSTVEEWNQGGEFINNVRENDVVTINGPFTSTTRVRFRCDASGNSDYVYLDDIDISGCANGVTAPIVAANRIKQDIGDDGFDLDDLSVYPNPVRDVLKIQNLPENARVRLMSISGQVIEKSLGKREFNMSALNPGLYFLQVSSEGETKAFKVVKQK